ncbi:proton-conducting transporter transmembrane domain-containing protein [Halococcus hamelinensis]|uniref:proton-conducting transporter transmembrane domain-containing protein n=1 Tax=Halococcus hamelinensis TaxID=332168 RepID=UPI0005D13C95
MTDVVSVLPATPVALPALAIVFVSVSRARPNLREAWTLLAAVATLVTVWLLIQSSVTHVMPLGSIAGVAFVLRADAAGLLFALLAATLWLVTSVYSIGYVRALDERSQTTYFAAFAASIAATMGVAFAANLLTLFVFYELLTLATYPLVVHTGSPEARDAGRTYVAYTLGGGVVALGGTVLVSVLAGSVGFAPGGIDALTTADPTLTRAAFALLVVGFGVKAAVMPLHGWLPTAMVAPTPVSGLLHAVAVVKSGVFAIGRTTLYIFGPDMTWDLGVGLPLAVAAAITMVIAGVIGLRQDNLKRGLAYSTVSQLSYIALGFALATPLSVFGAFLHIVAHAFMKITLFLAAGVIAVETGEKYVSNLAGVGRRLPATMTAFAVAAAGLIGFPLVAGFVSKFHLILGAAGGPSPVFVGAYLLAGLLKLLYFWPIIYLAFFGRPGADTPESRHAFAPPHTTDVGYVNRTAWKHPPPGREASPLLLVPVLSTVGVAVALGIAPTLFPFWELAETVVVEVFG